MELLGFHNAMILRSLILLRGFKKIDMQGVLTAKIDKASEGGYWATCLEVSGANGQGETVKEAKTSLKDAVMLILEDHIEDLTKGFSNEL